MKLATMANYGDKGIIYAEYDSATGMSSGYVEVGGATMPIGAFDVLIKSNSNAEPPTGSIVYGDFDTVKKKILAGDPVICATCFNYSSGYRTSEYANIANKSLYDTSDPDVITIYTDVDAGWVWSSDGTIEFFE